MAAKPMCYKPLLLIEPDWPAPENVQSLISTRQGGCSLPPYNSANLGDHVGDDLTAVSKNRQLLSDQTGMKQWSWLDQVHGIHIVDAHTANLNRQSADGIYSHQPNQTCSVLTADCLPVLICNQAGTEVAAVHAGWRGLAAGIVDVAIKKFSSEPADLMVYLGPAISNKHFEVGQEVRSIFINSLGVDAEKCFSHAVGKDGHYFADLYALARLACTKIGVDRIYGGDYCTYEDKDRFFSYRRDGETGRMVSAIWLAKS